MIRFLTFTLTLILLMTVTSCANERGALDEKPVHEVHTVDGATFSVLVFTKTAGFRHDSIESGVEAVKTLGEENGFSVTHTEDSDYFTSDNLANYAVVLFLNSTMTVFDDDQRAAFKSYIQNGGGYAGVHSATDTEYDWPWYGELAGGYFESHPRVQTAVIDVIDGDHPSTRHLPEQWEREDEWYNFQNFNENVNVLLKLDTDTFEGSEHPGDHPIAWYHEYDGGRAFYTGLGHTRESYTEPAFLEHLLGGLRYAAGIEN
ncbi:MAG: ThuA domain-containing protein [Balneolaceae bacterium]|nr:ThuA domain-containing protein [Balneolaceae bacterium]